MEDPRRLQSLFVHSKADKVIDGMEAASPFVVEQLVRRRSIARDLYQHRRHTVATLYCVAYCQLYHLICVGRYFFLFKVWAKFESTSGSSQHILQMYRLHLPQKMLMSSSYTFVLLASFKNRIFSTIGLASRSKAPYTRAKIIYTRVVEASPAMV